MTPRLKRIVELLPVSDELFDVGCDHGFLTAKLLETVPGLTMATSCVRKSPKKPPVIAPTMKVLRPQSPSRLNSSPLVPLGRYFLPMMTEAIIMSKP